MYVVSPTPESVDAIKRDFRSSSEALYCKVHLFFLERVPPELVDSIKQCPALVSRLKTFKASLPWYHNNTAVHATISSFIAVDFLGSPAWALPPKSIARYEYSSCIVYVG